MDAQQINEMQPKLQCLQPALVKRKRAQSSSMTMTDCTSHNQHFKKLNRARNFALIHRLQNACCVSRHENNINLTVNFHHSWVTRYIVSEQYFERSFFFPEQ